MASVILECEQMIYMGSRIGWSTCGATPTRLVTFPRTPPMSLCEEHEREATEARRPLLPNGKDPTERPVPADGTDESGT